MALYWSLVVGLSPGIVGILRTLFGWSEQGKFSAEVFAYRERALTFVTTCGVFAAIAVVVAVCYDLKDGLGLISVVCVELAALCRYWRHFENQGFVMQFVEENKERCRFLLFEGFEMGGVMIDAVMKTVENELVEFWRNELTKKLWTDLSEEELGELMFTSGLETAKVIVNDKNDDVHWKVAACMKEWLKRFASVRVPERARKNLQEGSQEVLTLTCIAIIVSNNTRDVRDGRATDSMGANPPRFPTAGTIAVKAAIEGILQPPNCLLRSNQTDIQKISYNAEKLSILAKDKVRPCREVEIPQSVDYTLKQMIEAGYLKSNSDATITVNVSFKDSRMIFVKNDWNPTMEIKLHPFKYVTAAMWMGSDPAFIVEERDNAGIPTGLGGSRSLSGILRVEAKLEKEIEVEECMEWLETADIRYDETGIWGNVEDFIQPKPVSVLNWPALGFVRTAWALPERIMRLYAALQDRERG